MQLPDELAALVAGDGGPTRQKAARLVVDLASTAGVEEFVRCTHAHVSGVSVITGGLGLRRFLADLSGDALGKVAIPTTLNSSGCDEHKMEEMDIDYDGFLEQQFEIIKAYSDLGIDATLSCTPYDAELDLGEGIGSWAESNAVCFSNSYTSLITNRESGLSALATALTGWAPRWGLHLAENRVPNIRVRVEADLDDSTDWSILGDWIGAQIQPEWDLPWGPMPLIIGLPSTASFEMRKALTSAAANHGCPMLWADGITTDAPVTTSIQGELVFTEAELKTRYDELAPMGTVDLVVIGCPQASIGEVRMTAAAVRARMELGQKISNRRLWVFTSAHNYRLLEAEGTIDLLETAGTLVLRDTCPEVTPYNRKHYNHLLTNSMKAEHYLTSGLNKMPTSVAKISECVAHAFEPELVTGKRPILHASIRAGMVTSKTIQSGKIEITGRSVPSQESWNITGKTLVSDVPITWLGYVDAETGIIQEPGHPLDGESVSGKILVYPKGSGSTVAPFVLMGLIYAGRGPLAIINRDVCPLTLPGASLLGLPYGMGFDADPCVVLNSGDEVRMRLQNGVVTLSVIERVA
jgi:predicted aconitase/predicted aconitase with swiveling domain